MPSGNFSLKEEKEYLVVVLPTIFDEKALQGFQVESKTWLMNTVGLFVLDFHKCPDLPVPAQRVLSQFAQTIKKNSKRVASIGVTAELKKSLTNLGLSALFNVVADIDQAKRQAGIKVETKRAVDPKFLTPFIEGVAAVMKMQMSVDVERKPPAPNRVEPFGIDIAGVLQLSTTSFAGTIALTFPEKTFLFLYEKMVGEKPPKITDEQADAAAEILNMVYGHAKTLLKEKGYDLGMAIPTVLTGNKLSIYHKSQNKAVYIPFGCSGGPFEMEIVFD